MWSCFIAQNEKVKFDTVGQQQQQLLDMVEMIDPDNDDRIF